MTYVSETTAFRDTTPSPHPQLCNAAEPAYCLSQKLVSPLHVSLRQFRGFTRQRLPCVDPGERHSSLPRNDPRMHHGVEKRRYGVRLSPGHCRRLRSLSHASEHYRMAAKNFRNRPTCDRKQSVTRRPICPGRVTTGHFAPTRAKQKPRTSAEVRGFLSG
jgi:hypothetical protein